MRGTYLRPSNHHEVLHCGHVPLAVRNVPGLEKWSGQRVRKPLVTLAHLPVVNLTGG